MDVTCSYVTDCMQTAKSLKIFKDFVVQGQGLVKCKLVLEDPRGQGLSSRTITLPGTDGLQYTIIIIIIIVAFLSRLRS